MPFFSNDLWQVLCRLNVERISATSVTVSFCGATRNRCEDTRPEFRSPSPLLYQNKKRQQRVLLSLSVVPPGIGAGTQGQNLGAPVLCSTKTKKDSNECYCLFLWCHQESNRGHKDFQSFALPTELWHQFAFSSVSAVNYHCCLFASAKVRRYLLSCKKMRNVLLIFIGYVDVSETLLCNFQ